MNSLKARLTLISSTLPAAVTKRFSLVNGQLHKETSANIVRGRMEVREVTDLSDFAGVLEGLGPAHALAYGLPADAPVELVTERAWVKTGRPAGQLPRTEKTMAYAHGPGLMMFDIDGDEGSTPQGCEQAAALVRRILPGLAISPMLWLPSTSSLIYRKVEDTPVRGLCGQRIYLLVSDASDIPRAGMAVTAYCWAAGYGRIAISKSGILLPRTPFDASVWQASHIDFAAGAVCAAPLEQRRGSPVLVPGDLEIVDTRVAIPEPDAETVAKARAAEEAAREKAAPAARAIREKWIEERAQEIAGTEADVERLHGCRETTRRAVERGELAGDFRITIADEGASVSITVAEVLEHPERYHGLPTLDPLEPDYDGGRCVGKLFLLGAAQNLFSFAHGGANYRLLRQPKKVQLVKGRERDAVLATLELMQKASDVFDFGDELVTLDRGRLHPLEAAGLRFYLGGLTQYWKSNVRGEKVQEVLEDPPERLCKAILSLKGGRHLKTLAALITAPVARLDGSILQTPGYDPSTGLLLDPDEEAPSVPDEPTEAQAKVALVVLWKPFRDFPFNRDVDRGVMLACLLTAVLRAVLPTAPGFGFDAPVQGSGKTLLAKCIAVIATGELPTTWPHTSGDDEEVRKRLFTALREGARVVLWDNVLGTLDSASMAAILTSESITDRVLSRSEAATVPNRALIILSGNNLTLAGDLPRRILTCRIDPETDRPFAREFDVDPLAYCRAHRQELVAAALTLIRAYQTSARERAKGRMASFEAWDDLVRQTVAWVGRTIIPKFADPMEAVDAAHAADPEQESWGRLLVALKEHFGNRPWGAREVADIHFTAEAAKKGVGNCALIDTPETAKNLAAALDDFRPQNGTLTAVRLGRVFSYRKDRIVSGLRLGQAGKDRNSVALWTVRGAGDAG